MHGSIGVEGIESAKVRTDHVLGGIQVDNWPLADGGHEYRVTAVAGESQGQRRLGSGWVRRHVNVKVLGAAALERATHLFIGKQQRAV